MTDSWYVNYSNLQHTSSVEDTITVYSEDVGKTFKTVKGTKAVYQLTGDELFVRAHVISDRDLDRKNELDEFFKAEALTQPVGWEKHINTRSASRSTGSA